MGDLTPIGPGRSHGSPGTCSPSPTRRGSTASSTSCLENACRYSPDDRAVEIRARVMDEGIVVSVIDQGSGMDRDVAWRSFEQPFSTGEATLRKEKAGAGVGLHLSRQLVVRHGGILWTDPVPAGGTRVSFCLPSEGGRLVRRPSRRRLSSLGARLAFRADPGYPRRGGSAGLLRRAILGIVVLADGRRLHRPAQRRRRRPRHRRDPHPALTVSVLRGHGRAGPRDGPGRLAADADVRRGARGVLRLARAPTRGRRMDGTTEGIAATWVDATRGRRPVRLLLPGGDGPAASRS